MKSNGLRFNPALVPVFIGRCAHCQEQIEEDDCFEEIEHDGRDLRFCGRICLASWRDAEEEKEFITELIREYRAARQRGMTARGAYIVARMMTAGFTDLGWHLWRRNTILP